MSASEEIRSIRESILKRYYLKGYAAGLICRMYLIMIRDVLRSPAVIRRYALGCGTLREELEKKIDAMVLSERDRKILKRKKIDDITFEDLESEFGLSVRRLKDICKKYKYVTE